MITLLKHHSGYPLGTKVKNKRPGRKLFLHMKDDSGLDQLTFADGLEVECEKDDTKVICFLLLYAFQSCFLFI